MGKHLSGKLFMERIIATVIIVTLAMVSSLDSPWNNKWSWSMYRKPIENIRRTRSIPVKSPDFQCKCPPYKECVVEFKIDEGMPDLLHLQGVIYDDEVKEFKNDIEKLKHLSTLPLKEQLKDGRRKQTVSDNECCCPPRSLMMPTFITDNKFEKVIEKIKKHDA